MMTINIRKGYSADLDQVHNFFNSFFSLQLEGISLRPDGIDKEQARSYIPEQKSDREKLCLLAYVDDTLAGLLSFSRYQKLEYRHCGDFGMAILPEYWRMGIGMRLLSDLELWCKHCDITKIEMSVWGNNSSAIRLYERLGYQHEGRRKGSIIRNQKTIDLLLMGKHI